MAPRRRRDPAGRRGARRLPHRAGVAHERHAPRAGCPPRRGRHLERWLRRRAHGRQRHHARPDAVRRIRSRPRRYARTRRPARRIRHGRPALRRPLARERDPAPRSHGRTMTDIRVAIVDDQELVRMGLRMVLDAQPDITVIAEAADGSEAIALAANGGVDVMLMDVRMPGLDGIAATESIASLDDPPRVLVLTTFDLDAYAFAAPRPRA